MVVQKILGLQGAELIFIINPKNMLVEKVKGIAPLIKKLKKLRPGLGPCFEKILTEPGLRDPSDHPFGFFLGCPDVIPKSKRWTASHTTHMGPIGKFATKHRYRYAGRTGDIHRIEVRGDVKYLAPNVPNNDLPFTIRGANLKSTKSHGEISFDSSKGRMAKQTVTTHIQGTITVEIADKNTVVSLNQTQTVQTNVMDQNPIEIARIVLRIFGPRHP